MTPREIVARAWAITIRERQLWRWGFTESLFATLLNIKMLGYQAYFVYAYMQGHEAGLFDDFIWIYEVTGSMAFTLSVVIFFAVLLVIEFFMPHLTLGAIVGLSAKAHRGEEVKGGLVIAVYNFFPLFALHELFILSGWSMALTAASLSLRYFPAGIAYTAVAFAIGTFVLSNILMFFASFAQHEVVLRKRGVFEGISRSYKLMLSHMGQIVFLMILLLLVTLRVLINTVIIFLIPAVALAIGLLLTYVFSPLVSYLIGSVIALAMVVVVSYFLAYLHVFRETVWTLMFLELEQHKELDDFGEAPIIAEPRSAEVH